MGSFIRDDDGFIVVYVDGSCPSNGRYNAKAGIGVWFRNGNPFNLSAPVIGNPTNINAEIQAVTAAANQALKANIQYLKIYTDSEFVINCATKWIENWMRDDNWKTESGEPVKNEASLIDMYYAIKRLEKVEFKHVRGHRGNYGNEQADRLARDGAERY